ncbi:aminoglycoside phosphotransferase family protein [Actinomadura sp. KC216]|uniref:phosphotransferase family protein n=1 Tax=Actinomadura sp. KC216 TaxID=2530370 RepID=UPI00140446B1|nr:aminoglycoside phosphotransferase family protein [Actinomadura sp. KC216]
MIESSPPIEALTWAARAAGEPVRVVRRLPGGTHAATHLLATAESRRELVLRRFPPGDTAAADEARVLGVLDGLGGRAPRLLGADPDGRRCGEPAVLTTRLPGRADITSVDPGTAAVHLGRVLARLHATPPALLPGLRDGMAAALASPARGHADAPGAQKLAAHVHRLTEAEEVLTHYDFWSGNVLWEGGALTGVVDWSGASRAPRGFDVAWCRLDWSCSTARKRPRRSRTPTRTRRDGPSPTSRSGTCSPSPTPITPSRAGCPTTTTSAGRT